ncbi:MAG: complex I NDUFA9 subunit family protein [Proteobacteria bacterium]|nr:complex I NDUFA9 subunit family protein [Pseudomonadota bacterium]
MTAIPSAKLVTIFGGSGFIGRHIVRALANEGWRIRVAVRRPNCAHFLKPMGRVGQIQLLKTNVRSNDDVTAALTNADAAINLVGIVVQRRRQRFESLHIEAAERIARTAHEKNVGRLIHFSALGANASAPARYFQTKAEGEARVRAEFAGATIVRPGLVFGSEDVFFNRFAALAQIAPVLPLYGGGQTRFQPVFVGDLAQAVAQILRDPAMAGRVTALAGPEVFTFEEVMRIVLRETCRKRLFMRLPMWLGRLQGAILQCLPKPILTYDQVRMLETDTVADGTVPGLPELGITPMAVDAIISSYLWRFRPRGQFKTAA